MAAMLVGFLLFVRWLDAPTDAAAIMEVQKLNQRLDALERIEVATERTQVAAKVSAANLPIGQDLPHPRTQPPPRVEPPKLVMQPLPNCSVVFFHHLEKTAGTTLRSVLQRHAQLGLFDFFSFVNRFNKIQFQMVTHRLDTLTRTPGGLAGTRLAVEIHIGGGGYEQFMKYTLPDLLHLRAKLRGAGCRCNLVTLLRHPLMQHISWHHHFVNHRVPLCFWNNPHDCQARMAMALACHGGPAVRALRTDHRRVVGRMWEAFDLVGVTERFDEFLVLLVRATRHRAPPPRHLRVRGTTCLHAPLACTQRSAPCLLTSDGSNALLSLSRAQTDLTGIQLPVYRSQLSTEQTAAAITEAQAWTRRECASLVADPPAALLEYIRKRMAQSAKSAAEFKRNKGRADSRGPPGMMDCAGYGPCSVPGFSEAQTVQYTWFEQEQCDAVTPQDVLSRLCARMVTDEPLYHEARERFEARVSAAGAALRTRVRLVNEAGAALSAQAERQAEHDPSRLALAAGTSLKRPYRIGSGGGAPWVVDELASWYKPHERARLSCVNCSGDVVPEFDLVGCWPLWAQFGPDEMRFRCTRHWTDDPGKNHPADFLRAGSSLALPCWQTCWEPLEPSEEAHRETGALALAALDSAGRVDPGMRAKHCTAPCPGSAGGGPAVPALVWRGRWDQERAAFQRANAEARELVELTEFIRPLSSEDFYFSVF